MFLEQLADQILLRYLAVAHFGRGRGEFRDEDASHRWQEIAAGALRSCGEEWSELWQAVATDHDSRSERLRRLLDETMRAVLVEGYPEAAGLLGVEMAPEEPEDVAGDGAEAGETPSGDSTPDQPADRRKTTQ